MSTTPKIKIEDNSPLRSTLDAIYAERSQHELAKWSLSMATHVFALTGYDVDEFPTVLEALAVNEAWQRAEARVHEVRQAGFWIHELAKATTDPLLQAVLRVAGQAVGTGHMREHAMVASDYAIKAVNLLHPGDSNAVARERQWQIAALRAMEP